MGTKMNNTFKLLAIGTTSLGLSACSGAGTSGIETISPSEATLQVFSDESGDLGAALQGDETLTARSVGVAGANLNYSTGETSLTDATEVSVTKNANGELEFTLNGVRHTFTAADRQTESDGNVYGYDVSDTVNGVYYSLYNHNGELDDLLSAGNGWSTVVRVQSNQIVTGGEPNLNAFAVIGTETQDSALAGIASATYSGRARLNSVPAAGFDNNGNSRTGIRSNLAMTVDFDAGEISGSLDNVTIQEPGMAETSIAGSITMNQADFTQNAFGGTLTPDSTWVAAGNPSFQNGTYSGAFFGPDAEEIGGAISATGGSGVDAFNAYGYFIGEKD
jgi:hypothetical protein